MTTPLERELAEALRKARPAAVALNAGEHMLDPAFAGTVDENGIPNCLPPTPRKSDGDMIELDAALAEFDAAEAQGDEWLPIETAPIDDTMFLAGWEDGRMCIMRGSILHAQRTRKHPTPEHLQFQCTHWQPLPNPPKAMIAAAPKQESDHRV